MKFDNFDDRYNYYFCGVNGYTDISNIFTFGLTIDNDNVLEQNFTEKVLSVGLDKSLSEYAKMYNYDRVYVIKIPAYYIGWVHRNGKIEPFVPILISNNSGDSRVVPNLIYGVYDKKHLTYISNDIYNPIYELNGLNFANIQLRKMYKYGCFQLYMDAMRRSDFSYEELKVCDEEIHKWDRVLRHYSRIKFTRVLKRIIK